MSTGFRDEQLPEVRSPVETDGRLLQAHEVADLLCVPVTWVREATRTGRLPHIRLGRYIRYELEVVMNWVTEQRLARPTRPTGHPDR